MVEALLALGIVVVAGAAAGVPLRDRARMRRLRLRLAIERTPPGPRRQLIRLRGRLQESAAVPLPAGGVATTLLADARAVAAQLDAHLESLLADPDDRRLETALPTLRLHVEEVDDALAQARLASVATPPALLQASIAELRAAVERDRRVAAEVDAALTRHLPSGPSPRL
ncbi:MAG TPA: hypothetical protein VGP96_04235 [Candidatus Dormibacteraeota bacterium]|jgi:hypothetical protein|nr:hypothetical protein [Candidatus Dormibacteraeota bacterium]